MAGSPWPHSCQLENAARALRAGGVVLVFPGGIYDAYRPTVAENVIDFNGRTGYVRAAIEAQVPIVPVVSIGGQEGQLFLTRGTWLAKRLGLSRWRSDILPVTVGLPFGLSMIMPPNLPLPTKIVSQVLEPIDVVTHLGTRLTPSRSTSTSARRCSRPWTGWPASGASRFWGRASSTELC